MLQNTHTTMEKSIIIVCLIGLVAGFGLGLYLGKLAYGLQLDAATDAFNTCRELYNKNCVFKINDPNILILNNLQNKLNFSNITLEIGDVK